MVFQTVIPKMSTDPSRTIAISLLFLYVKKNNLQDCDGISSCYSENVNRP